MKFPQFLLPRRSPTLLQAITNGMMINMSSNTLFMYKNLVDQDAEDRGLIPRLARSTYRLACSSSTLCNMTEPFRQRLRSGDDLVTLHTIRMSFCYGLQFLAIVFGIPLLVLAAVEHVHTLKRSRNLLVPTFGVWVTVYLVPMLFEVILIVVIGDVEMARKVCWHMQLLGYVTIVFSSSLFSYFFYDLWLTYLAHKILQQPGEPPRGKEKDVHVTLERGDQEKVAV